MNRTLAAFIAGALFATLIAWLFSGRNGDQRETAPAREAQRPRVYRPIAPPPRRPRPPPVNQPQYAPYGTNPNPGIAGYRFRPLDDEETRTNQGQPPVQPYPDYPPASPQPPRPMYDYAPPPARRDRERRWIGNY